MTLLDAKKWALSMGVLLTLAGVAHAADQTILPVAACFGFDGVGYNYYGGISSSSTGGLPTVYCSVGQDQALDLNDDIRVYYRDGHAITPVRNFSCNAYEVSVDRSTVVASGWRYGCATPGGCSSDPGLYAASGYINFADQSHGGSYAISLNCNIPPIVAGVADSEIYSIMIDEQ